MRILGILGLLTGCASGPQGTDVGGLFNDPGKALEDPAKKPKVRPKTEDTIKPPEDPPAVPVTKAPEKPVNPPASALVSAQVSEDAQLRPLIRVKLNGLFSAKNLATPGFSLSGGQKILEVLDQEALRPGTGNPEAPAEVFLRFEGTLTPGTKVSYGPWEGSVEVQGAEILPAKAPAWDGTLADKVPEVVLPGHPQWVETYQGAWAWNQNQNLQASDPWHRVLAPLSLVYGDPQGVQKALDALYVGQTETGEIPGLPPLLAWAEWKYARITGDLTRIPRILGPLDQFHQGFVKKYSTPDGGVWLTDALAGGSGTPREKSLGQGTWADGTAMLALNARCLEDLARWAQNLDVADRYAKEFFRLRERVSSGLWDRDAQLYRDKLPAGTWGDPGALSGFWALTAGIPAPDRGRLLAFEHLAEGKPLSLTSAKTPLWPPMIYALIQGLETYAPSLAFPLARDFLDRVAQVYLHFDPQNSPLAMAPLDDPQPRRGDGLRQFWEAYSASSFSPGPRSDGKYLSSQAAGVYGGLAAVNLLLESVLGLEVRGAENLVRWAPRLKEVQGVRGLRVGPGELTVIYDPRRKTLEGRASSPLNLELVHPDSGRIWRAAVPQGRFLFNLE